MSNVRQHLFSGAVSGFSSAICLQPFDLLKTRLQQVDGKMLETRTMTLMRTAREIVRTTGPLGLWRGTAATLLRNVPGVAVYFTGLNQLRAFMATSPYFASYQSRPANQHASVLPKLTGAGNMLSGAAARTTVGFILNPFAVIKARFESNLYAYESLSSAFLSLARAGPSELFRGFIPSALRDAPYAGLFIVFYEGIKHEATTMIPPSSATLSAGIHSGAAAAAGGLATIVTHPFDVVKTKMQVRKELRYHGVLKTTATILQQRGLMGFFDGVLLRMTRKVFSSAIGWAVYEGILMFMRSSQPNKDL